MNALEDPAAFPPPLPEPELPRAILLPPRPQEVAIQRVYVGPTRSDIAMGVFYALFGFFIALPAAVISILLLLGVIGR